MKKIFYNKDGWVCDRYPYDIPKTNICKELEIEDNIYEKTLCCEFGKCWRVENGELESQVYNENDYNKSKNENEIHFLKDWFKEYDLQVSQYNRCQRLGINFDKDINDLDNQAKINSIRIKELLKEI